MAKTRNDRNAITAAADDAPPAAKKPKATAKKAAATPAAKKPEKATAKKAAATPAAKKPKKATVKKAAATPAAKKPKKHVNAITAAADNATAQNAAEGAVYNRLAAHHRGVLLHSSSITEQLLKVQHAAQAQGPSVPVRMLNTTAIPQAQSAVIPAYFGHAQAFQEQLTSLTTALDSGMGGAFAAAVRTGFAPSPTDLNGILFSPATPMGRRLIPDPLQQPPLPGLPAPGTQALVVLDNTLAAIMTAPPAPAAAGAPAPPAAGGAFTISTAMVSLGTIRSLAANTGQALHAVENMAPPHGHGSKTWHLLQGILDATVALTCDLRMTPAKELQAQVDRLGAACCAYKEHRAAPALLTRTHSE